MISSREYRPDPRQCCEACVFGRGQHAEWCTAAAARQPKWPHIRARRRIGIRNDLDIDAARAHAESD